MPAKTKVEDLVQFLGRPHMMGVVFHVGAVAHGPVRFSEIHQALGISPNTLTTRLKDLVGAGFLARQSYDEIPPRVEYSPTSKLLELVPVFRGMHEWCDAHALDAADE